tara:strand:+ start:124551 stop:124778 length:228 start_codon:yes stop_codon:yes gene_type:complete
VVCTKLLRCGLGVWTCHSSGIDGFAGHGIRGVGAGINASSASATSATATPTWALNGIFFAAGCNTGNGQGQRTKY